MVNHLLLSRHKRYLKVEKADELIKRYEKLARKLNNLNIKKLKIKKFKNVKILKKILVC